MPRKQARNTVGHEIWPVASSRPAPMAATSSRMNVAKKNPAAFANGIHSAMACGESGNASVMQLSKSRADFLGCLLMLECAGRNSESGRQRDAHQPSHDTNERVM